MLEVGVVTLFPDMFAAVRDFGVTGRAVERGLLSISCWNPRDFTADRHRTVDDRPYGGGPGMVMMVEPLRAAIDAAARRLGPAAKTILLTPQGRPVDHSVVAGMAAETGFTLVCGRYEGVDERLVDLAIDEELSLGDFVLSGGEIAAMALIDAVARLRTGVLGAERSAVEDSFSNGLLDCPHFTRPEVIDGRRVPAVLLSGDHEAVRRWRLQEALRRTWLRRPDLIDAAELDDEQRALLDDILKDHDASPEGARASSKRSRP